MPDQRLRLGAAVSGLAFWGVAGAGLLLLLGRSPWWSGLAMWMVIGLFGMLWFATSMLERAAGAAWLRNEERAKAAAGPRGKLSEKELADLVAWAENTDGGAQGKTPREPADGSVGDETVAANA